MTIGSLFSGIGGLEMGLALCKVGPVRWQCDNNPDARAVLAKHWPNAKRYEDVREIDGKAEKVDVICGGFPCQDVSHAGKRAGIHGERSGLWFEFARVVRELRPRYVFVENVPGLLSDGMGDVLGDLASLGYDAEWECVPAAAVGAPHLRARVWVLAYPRGERDEADDAVQTGRDVAEFRAWWAPEFALSRVDDGRRNGSHTRLRLLGNAVVPQQAALAWLMLRERVRRVRSMKAAET